MWLVNYHIMNTVQQNLRKEISSCSPKGNASLEQKKPLFCSLNFLLLWVFLSHALLICRLIFQEL